MTENDNIVTVSRPRVNTIRRCFHVTCGSGPSDVSGGYRDDQQSQQDSQEAVSSQRAEGHKPEEKQNKGLVQRRISVSSISYAVSVSVVQTLKTN